MSLHRDDWLKILAGLAAAGTGGAALAGYGPLAGLLGTQAATTAASTVMPAAAAAMPMGEYAGLASAPASQGLLSGLMGGGSSAGLTSGKLAAGMTALGLLAPHPAPPPGPPPMMGQQQSAPTPSPYGNQAFNPAGARPPDMLPGETIEQYRKRKMMGG